MIGRLGPAVAALVVLAASGPAHAVPAEPVPQVMAALGDSISSGFNSCGWYVSCPSRSWSAGDNAAVDSHYTRMLRLGPPLKGHNRNFAVPGSTSADLMGQVRQAVEAKAGYVTVLIGAQDACKRTESEMTPVAVYRSRIDAALAALRAGVPQARVFLAGIPDLRRLWQVGRESPLARTFWTVGRICQSMLARPASDKRADVERRARVRERVIAYNREAARACALMGPSCRSDGGAVFSYPFTIGHLSKWDYFHPNAAGQRALAERTFARGFDWTGPALTTLP
ncbi:GDSL-type esterase/lipase family protein [Nonomuraea sp. SBT364]|uniref:GDSL-type esterase/lipase family protein n=1 Tax=Nonomuraea sp. SBT364 TaxID=1580530 RepID=UPI00066C9DA6|nr:GDSL-type esterase/lipase family protein [Nonomuraea sp. SBT364]